MNANNRTSRGTGGGMGMGQGSGAGTGRGRGGGGRGRMGGIKAGGALGNCLCPKCGNRQPHERGIPCTQIKCSQCGSTMIRE